jgi:hypothetical protein
MSSFFRFWRLLEIADAARRSNPASCRSDTHPFKEFFQMPKKKNTEANPRNGKPASRQPAESAIPAAKGPLPDWRSEIRTFLLGEQVVKHFGRAAGDAQLILDALQAQGWASLIDNPLPRIPGRNRKTHLHDVIENFNRRLDRPLVKLRRSGDRVGWEIL